MNQMLTKKTNNAIDTFFNLNGNTYREKKKSLNTFVKTLQTEYSYEEIQDFVNNLITTTEYDRSCKTEIIVCFQLESSIIEILKSGNEADVGKVLKNSTFFKNLIHKMSIDDFIDNFLPQLSYKTNVNVIKIIGNNMNDNAELADNLFNKLEKKYSITFAIPLLHSCSLNLIKDKCSKYGLHLSCRYLLLIYKKHPEILKYYFDMMREKKQKHESFSKYCPVFKYIATNNIKWFWELYENYQFDIKVGRRLAIKLLPTQEIMLKYGFANKSLFEVRHLLKAARKLNLHKELILNYYPNDINDYIRNISPDNSPIIYMPRKEIFPLLLELFTEMYKKDFRNYISLMNGKFLKYVTIEEREYILDRMSDKKNFLHYYPINRSIPMLKEKLKCINDPNIHLKLISSLFQTCNINNDAKALLDLLKFVYERYKNDRKPLSQLILDITRSWKDYSRFTEEHWETIYNLIEYLDYLGIYGKWDHFFEKHFVWLVDNNKSCENLLEEYIGKFRGKICIRSPYSFEKSLKYMKAFIVEIHNRLPGKDSIWYFHLLHTVINFHKRFPNEINLLDYEYILEYGITHGNDEQSYHVFYFVKNYNKIKSFNKCITYFEEHARRNRYYRYDITGIVLHCLENCPEELDNFENLHKRVWLLKNRNKKILKFLLCPYFVKKHIQVFNKFCVEQLEDTETNIDALFLLHLFSYDKTFIDVIPNFLPLENAEIELNTDKIYVKKQQEIIKHIPRIPTPESMKLMRTLCKADYLKYVLGLFYKIAYKVPQNLLPEFLQNVYESDISVKKHVLYLGRLLLPLSSYHDFLLVISQLETM